MYIFKAKNAFSDNVFPGLKAVLLKKTKKAPAEEAVNVYFLSLKSEHLLKRIKPFRIVYLKSGLQDLRLSTGKHEIIGGPKSQKNGSGHTQNNIILFPARS